MILKKKRIKNIFFWAFLSVLLVSCSKDLKQDINNLNQEKISKNNSKKDVEKIKEKIKEEKKTIYLLIDKEKYLDVLKMYDKTTSIAIRKDKKIIDFLTAKILSEVDKRKTKLDKLTYLKNSIVIFPYSKKLVELYLNLSWKNKFSLIDAINNYIKYKNLFNYNDIMLKKLIYYSLNYYYQENKDNTLLNLMISLNIEESSKMLESLIEKGSYLGSLNKIPDLKIDLLISLIKNPDFTNKKEVIKQFLKKSNKEKLLEIYNNLDKNTKLNIYYNYFHISKEEIDNKLIDGFLARDGKNYHKIAFQLIKEFKLKRYKEKLLKYMPLYQARCSYIRKLLIEALIEINPEFISDFLKKIDVKELHNIQKITFCKLKDKLKMKQNCNFPEIVKTGTENEKTEYLKLIFSQHRKIPKYFIDNFNNIYYINLFLDNYKQLSIETLKDISYSAYKDGDIRLLLKYLKRIDEKEVKEILNSKLPKYVKRAKLGKDTLVKLVYLSLLEKNYKNEIFTIKKYITKNNILNEKFAKLLVSRLKKDELFWLLRLVNLNTEKKIQIVFFKGIIEKL